MPKQVNSHQSPQDALLQGHVCVITASSCQVSKRKGAFHVLGLHLRGWDLCTAVGEPACAEKIPLCASQPLQK